MDKNKLVKENLIKKINLEKGFSSNYSKKIINDLIEIIIYNIKSGYFNLKNIGTFKTIQKKERIGRNPKTKKEYIISARKALSFTASKNLSKKIKELH